MWGSSPIRTARETSSHTWVSASAHAGSTRPDFQVISDEQYERLCRCTRASRTDSYGLILEGVILAIGEAAMRPREIFALHHSDVDYTTGLIHVRRQLDLASGITGCPRTTSRYMRRSTWSAHWHSIRATAQMPGLEFYELRHRAAQWMIDPPHDGGLGLDIQSTAHIAGHRDGGYLVCSTCSKLAEHRAIARTRLALDAYQQREQTAHANSKNRRLWRSHPAKNRAAAAIELQYAATTLTTTHSAFRPRKPAKCELLPPQKPSRYGDPSVITFQQKTPAKRGFLGGAKKSENRGGRI